MAEETPHEADPNYVPKRGESRTWLTMIEEAEKIYKDWQIYCDSIDKLYADLNRLATIDRSREFQIFWSTMEVVNPSIYARPPVPVVVPRFKDRRPLYTVTSELLERSCVTGMELEDIDSVMKLVRDDLGLNARGVIWVDYFDERGYSKKKKGEYVCPVHIDRRDFLHEPARKWKEVGWAARRTWLTEEQMQKRFIEKLDGDDKRQMSAALFKVMTDLKNRGGATAQMKCPVWEIWSKTENKRVWVTEGILFTLEEGEPDLDLNGFFPCPKPAFGTLQRQTLIPVPDMLQYKDQLEEVNALTNRIHMLSEAIKVKGFYPSGSEAGDAIETALNILNDRNVMVPIKDWNSLTTGTNGQPVYYWPVEVIAQVVAGLVELRNEVINNVYQIVGISDIMRGSTEKDETLGAQELKAQFGSIRIRDKQQELVRIARDTVRIMAEIMAEEFDSETLLAMSQMEIPTDADIREQVKPLEQQIKEIPKAAETQAKQIMQGVKQQVQQAAQDPQVAQQAQADPEKAKAMLQQAQEAAQQQVQQIAQQAQEQVNEIAAQVEKLQAKPTIEQIMKFLKDNKLRPFVLDIETDSTIQADEQAEKQARTEFVTALGGLVAQFVPLLQTIPAAAPMVGGVIKFALAPFRVGRELEGQIDETVEALTQQQGAQGPSPEQIAAEADAKAKEVDAATKKAEVEMKAAAQQVEDKRKADYDAAMLALQQKKIDGELQMKAALTDQESKLMQREYSKKLIDMQAAEDRANQAHVRDMENKALDIEAKQVSIEASRQQATINAAAGAQKMELTAEQAKAKNMNGAT